MNQNKIDDGGSAFPNVEQERVNPAGYTERERVENTGMSLRDYFAARALPAIIRDYTADITSSGKSVCFDDDIDADAVAAEAYYVADAMIRARKAGGQ